MENEKIEAKLILEQGVKFKGFTIKEPYLGTLDCISEYALDMSFSMEEFEANEQFEANKIVHKSVKNWGKIVACLVLNNKLMIRLFAPILGIYFKWKIKPSELIVLLDIIKTMQQMPTFIAATKLMSGVRTTAPKMVAEKKTAKVKGRD